MARSTVAYFKNKDVLDWRSVEPVELTATTCWCGIPVAIPTSLYNEMHRTSKQHAYCPLGHTFVYNDTMEKELAAARAQLVHERDQHEGTRRSLRAQKAATTRIKHRAEAGVCLHCKRTFKDVQAHMASKHPELVDAK